MVTLGRLSEMLYIKFQFLGSGALYLQHGYVKYKTIEILSSKQKEHADSQI